MKADVPTDDGLVEVKAWKADGEPFLTVHRTPHPDFCYHRPVEVDENKRVVTCKLCGAVLDPIEVLLRLARGEERMLATTEKLRAMRAQIEVLKAEEVRVKARLRRATARCREEEG